LQGLKLAAAKKSPSAATMSCGLSLYTPGWIGGISGVGLGLGLISGIGLGLGLISGTGFGFGLISGETPGLISGGTFGVISGGAFGVISGDTFGVISGAGLGGTCGCFSSLSLLLMNPICLVTINTSLFII
jgi:hypothetical protein